MKCDFLGSYLRYKAKILYEDFNDLCDANLYSFASGAVSNA